MKDVLSWICFFLLIPFYIIGRIFYLVSMSFDEWLRDYLEGDPYV